MGYSVESLEEAKYVRVVFEDAMTREEHESGRDEAIRTLAANGWKRLLVDASRIDAKMSVADDYEFTEQHQSTPLLFVRIAVVHRPDESERFKFIENVSVNRGADMKVFTDPEKAIAWLTVN